MKHNGVQLGDNNKGMMVFTSFMTSPSGIDVYVCTNCGYFETYIADGKKLADVAKNWSPVKPA